MNSFYPVSRSRLLPVVIIGLVTAFLVPAAFANLNLSPQQEAFDLEGMKMSQLTFNTGSNIKATYQPPRDWKYSGSNDYLDLQPEGVAQVKARVSKWSSSPELSFDAEGRKQLTEKILASLPEGSEQVKILSEELNPLRINAKQTYLVELSYIYYGERFACYSLFLDRKPEMLCFRLSCRETNYQALREAFHRSLYSWQNL